MDRFELHNCREPVFRDFPLDVKELAVPVFLGALPNQKEGVQDGNEAVFVGGK